jgi:hypothetical protein
MHALPFAVNLAVCDDLKSAIAGTHAARRYSYILPELQIQPTCEARPVAPKNSPDD